MSEVTHEVTHEISHEIAQLLATLKRQLKQQGKTYRDVAATLGLSEPSVKRLFSSGQFSLERLVEVCNLLGFTLAELAQEALASASRLRTLTAAQEKELVSDPMLLLVAVCALNHWTMNDMLAAYRLTAAQCLQRLLRLDRLHLISLLPGNRIRLNVSRDFDWLVDGPIRRYFREQGLVDFLDSDFALADQSLTFSHGMLTASALDKMHAELRQLRQSFARLHEESLASPLPKRRGSGLLLAMREWEPAGFTRLRR
ncbi:MAG: family transcriptional regulator [Massilia sp.]|jgi:transcriptional regulator with XRE-family HTH domain|nr:family transcriptional regulator [Massilia sp.]MDB5951895.1 family transcriptional regulator [Massilia sp.]